MIQIVFRESALAEAIAAYYEAIDWDITVRMIADIESSVLQLADFPSSGEAIPGTSLRKIVSRRYRFIISYFVAPNRVEIVGAFRFQNRQA